MDAIKIQLECVQMRARDAFLDKRSRRSYICAARRVACPAPAVQEWFTPLEAARNGQRESEVVQ